MKEDKKYFTTGQVAEHCGVNFRTVIRWINRGYLKVSRLPGRGDHRITIDDFIFFLNENNLDSKSILKIKDKDIVPKALIIDDEDLVVKSISRVFTNKGFEVLVACNGFKAGFLLSSEIPLIITLDLNMPTINGFDVLQIIEGLKFKEKIWIVVISGDTEENMKKAIDAGADFYLKKPFSRSDLEKIIYKVFPECNEGEKNIRRLG